MAGPKRIVQASGCSSALGVLLVVTRLLQAPSLLYPAIAACMLGTLGLLLYAYLLWRKDQRRLT